MLKLTANHLLLQLFACILMVSKNERKSKNSNACCFRVGELFVEYLIYPGKVPHASKEVQLIIERQTDTLVVYLVCFLR